ncbi:hypothetical protein QFC20_002606 [Naganishia adeliensis]|uniref:Uncharacterized protein n=1 Tax=Naganishia adeliensis TaxID=92952 RepID=A0ACC2WJF1_9TREE|nr:hypothetical protein QFC20_002606 [Naganishia adeliensis]
MADPDDSFDEDGDLVLAFIEQEQQTVVDTPLPSSQARQPTQVKESIRGSNGAAKRERKRSRSVSPIDGMSVRSMKPRVESPSSVSMPRALPVSYLMRRSYAKVASGSPHIAKPRESTTSAKKETHHDVDEKAVIWPPSQTYALDTVREQGFTSTTEPKSRVKFDSDPIVVKGTKGKSKATAINLDIKRDHEGNVTESGKKEINRHLLKTLGQKHNPITDSDLYTRTAHVVSCATGHQVAQRAGSKFSISEKSYFHSRNSKLREQFTAQAREGLRIAEGTEKAAELGGSGGGAVGIGGRFGAELSRERGEMDGGAMIQQSRIFAGLTFYLNGYTGPRISDLELKRLIAIHGGNVSFLANSSCTHILITKNLSASKTQKFLDSASSIRGGKRKVVHVDWVLDSVAKRKRLDETPYNIIVNKAQPTLMSSLGVTKQNLSSERKSGGDKPVKTLAPQPVEVISIDD